MADTTFFKNITSHTQWLRAYLVKVVPTSGMERMLHDHVEAMLDCIVALAYGEPRDLGCLYGGDLGQCFKLEPLRDVACNPCALSFSMFALKDVIDDEKQTGDAADLARMYVAMQRARKTANSAFSDVEAYERKLRDWISMVTPIPAPIDGSEDDRSGSCYIPKTTVKEMNDWIVNEGDARKIAAQATRTTRHNVRCPMCSRTWEDRGDGDTVASGRCLQCGSGPDVWERAPDGIDFRSQFIEKGCPVGDEGVEGPEGMKG